MCRAVSGIAFVVSASFLIGVSGRGFGFQCARLPDVFKHCDCFSRQSWLHCPNGVAQINGPLPRIPNGFQDFQIFNGNVTSIPPGTLPASLQRLVIRNSSLTSLPYDLPRGLITVDIVNNSVTDITPLTKLPFLRHIDVTMNKVESLPSNWPATMEHLELNSNNIREIPDLCKTNIKIIDAHQNLISSIDRLPTSLLQLNLPWNKMTSMDFLLKSNLTSLTIVDFFGNPDFDLNKAGVELMKHSYRSPCILDLRVGASATHRFPSWICSVFPHLTHLNFYNTLMEGIYDDSSAPVCHDVITIELHGNLLDRGIDVQFLKRTLPSLQYLTLTATLIECTCELFEYIKEYNITTDYPAERAKCGSPNEWTGFLLSNEEPPVSCNLTLTPKTVSETPLIVYVVCGVVFMACILAFALTVIVLVRRKMAQRKDKEKEKSKHVFDEEKPMNGHGPHPSLSAKRRAMKLPRSVTQPDDIVIPLSQRRRFKDVKYDDSAYLMPLSDRAKMANGGRTVSGIYENDDDINQPNEYVDLDELDFSIPADDAYSYWKHSNVESKVGSQDSVDSNVTDQQFQEANQKDHTLAPDQETMKEVNCNYCKIHQKHPDIAIQNPAYSEPVKSDANKNNQNQKPCQACLRDLDHILSQLTNQNGGPDHNMERYDTAKNAYLALLPDKTYITISSDGIQKLNEKRYANNNNDTDTRN